jgi:hypothetical protein
MDVEVNTTDNKIQHSVDNQIESEMPAPKKMRVEEVHEEH